MSDPLFDHDGSLKPTIKYYHCDSCQCFHFEDEPVFNEHLTLRSHSDLKRYPLEQRIHDLTNTKP